MKLLEFVQTYLISFGSITHLMEDGLSLFKITYIQ
jgi:hypothetical protein